ncbi:AAA family ATPase [Desulfovibrio litoralis]|uniref:AAA domain-containing protein n=1 Tax=Desulfovibrio litoralis DSM 11393 TaxID=1121455 RepID=A0A1M7TCN8_9BACT|nr:AAA family ATPase [Desulfovibrio litoralis]SHN68492.1 AAA domain-containing protein [Desulfovibrio litoralis DSM 11393]
MYIQSFNVERFGSLKEQTIDNLSPNLNIVFGLNEAGKSTTLKFFQALLFGYKRGSRKLDFNATPNKGGGSLTINSRELGRVSLLRRPGTHGGNAELFDINEQLLGESDLRRLLQGVNASLFDNIYAFSLAELQSIQSFENDELVRVFSGAMAGLGKVSPAEALKKIADEKKALFGKSNSGTIYHKIKELQEIEGYIAELGPSLPRYFEYTEEQASLSETLENLQREESALLKGKTNLSLLRSIQPKWLEYCTLKTELESFKKPEFELADDAVERLERLNSQKEEQELSVSSKQRTLERFALSLNELQAKKEQAEQLIKDEAQILRIIEAKESISNNYSELNLLHKDNLVLKERLNLRIKSLGSDWSLEKVASFNFSVNIAQELDNQAETLNISKLQLEKAQDRVLQSEKACLELKTALENAKAQIKAQESAVWTTELKKLLAVDEGFDFSALYEANILRENPEEGIDSLTLGRKSFKFLNEYLVKNEKQAHFELLCNKQGTIENILAQKEQTLRAIEENTLFLKQRLPAISPAWSEDFLANFDFSHAKRQALNDLIKTLREDEKEQHEANEAFNLNHDIYLGQQKRIKEIESLLTEFSELPERKELELRRSALRQLHLRYKELEESRRLYKKAETELSDFVQTEQSLALQLQLPWWKKINKILSLALFFTVLALGLLGLGLFLAKDLFSYLSIGVGVIATIFYGFNFIDPSKPRKDQASLEQKNRKETLLIEERNNTKQNIDRLLDGFSELLSDSGLNIFSLDELSFLELEKEYERLAKLFDQADKRDKLLNELLPLKDEANKNKILLNVAQERLSNINNELQKTRILWGELLSEFKLTLDLTPESVLDIYNEALSLRSKLDEIYKLKALSSSQERNLNDFETEVLSCLPASVISALTLSVNNSAHLCRTAVDFAVLFEFMQKQGKALKLLNDLSQEYHKLFNQQLFYQNEYQKQQQQQNNDLTLEKEAQDKLNQSLEAWQNQLKKYGFSPDFSQSVAKQSLQLVQEACELLSLLKDKEQAIINLNNKRLAFLEQLNAFNGGTLSLNSDLSELLTEIDRLRQALEQAKTVIGEYKNITQAYQNGLGELKNESERLEQTCLKLKDLLALAETESIEAFKVVFGNLKKWESSNAELFKLKAELQVACINNSLFEKELKETPSENKGEMAIEVLTETLQSKTLEQIQQELDILELNLSELNTQKMNLTARQGELKAQLEQLNTKDMIAHYRVKESEIKEELTRHRDQWLKLNIAYHLLSSTKQRLEEERMPSLIKEAGVLFSEFTEGAYTQINLSMSETSLSVKHLVVVNKNGLRLKQEELSQGTKEQLYLALRLAYIREHAKHKETLPIIMDDILVNFDHYRARKTAEVLNNFSQGKSLYQADTLSASENAQQLFFFTCHHSTAELLREFNPDAKFLHLEKGLFKAV